jgi:hypothetical protein
MLSGASNYLEPIIAPSSILIKMNNDSRQENLVVKNFRVNDNQKLIAQINTIIH